MICDDCQALYEEVADHARDSDVFAKVRRTDESLRCTARVTGAEAYFIAQVDESHDVVWVALATPDRWLSESIEADLVFKGETIEELLEEELFDQGFEARLPVYHFRDEERQYVFRSPVFLHPGQKLCGPQMIRRVTQVLLAYEACFRQLGDMTHHEVA